jgi:hypothetical protein
MPWLTWKQSAQNLLDIILNNRWYQQWTLGDVHRFWGSDERLGTQVGKLLGRDISSTNQAGFLLFGPYLALAAGQYQILIRGTFGESGAAGARMDVAVNKGTLILAESALDEPIDNRSLIVLPLSLDMSCTDLEVRVWVEAASDITISLLEIQPLQATELDNATHLLLSETATATATA